MKDCPVCGEVGGLAFCSKCHNRGHDRGLMVAKPGQTIFQDPKFDLQTFLGKATNEEHHGKAHEVRVDESIRAAGVQQVHEPSVPSEGEGA